MNFKHEILISFEDLSFEKQEEIRNAIAEFIKSDEEATKQITQEVNNEWIESPIESPMDYRKRNTVNSLVDLTVQEIAMKNADFRQYMVIEMEIEL